MAKLKTIKCPQCGSPNYDELGDDKYKCKSCGASYYFDKEKAELNINHNYNGLIDIIKESKKIIFGVIAVLLVFFALIFILPLIFSSKSKTPRYETYTVSESDNNKEEEYNESTEAMIGTFYKGQPVVLHFVKRDYRYTDPWKSSFVMKIIGKDKNIIEEKVIVDKTNPDDKQIKMFDDVKIKAFTNQSIWLIANSKFIFKLDSATFQIEPMNDKFVHEMKELSSGLSKVEFGYQIDGFKVINNEAVDYYLFPIINKVYEKEAFYRARSGEYGLTGNEIPEVGYCFYDGVKKLAEDSKPKKMLYIYRYLNYKYGPRHDFNANAASMGNRPDYVAWNKKNYKLQSINELTPGRYYFQASVVYTSPEFCIITYKVDISEESPQIMQCIDNTGTVLWTLPDTETKGRYECSAHQGNIFIFSDYWEVLAVDNTGKIILKYGD